MSAPDVPYAAIDRDLLDRISDGQTVLVFPSEVAARFWRRWAVTEGPRRALSTGRIVSWDAFKEGVFQIRSDRRPINAMLRRVFCERLLQSNRHRPFLRTLVQPAFKENSGAFAGMLQRALPLLPALEQQASRTALRNATLLDLSDIAARYRRFLDETGLFEPGWERSQIAAPREPHTIVFPELIADYREFASDLARQPTVSTYGLPGQGSATVAPGTTSSCPNARLNRHANAHQEVHHVLSQVERLLDDGVDPAEIVITVAELEAYEPFLQRYAELHAIPLHLHRGRPLSEFGAGRLFRGIAALVAGDFSFRALRGLLLDHAIPWVSPHLNRALVRAGIDGGCLKRGLGSAAGAALVSRPTEGAASDGAVSGKPPGSDGHRGGSSVRDQWLRAIAYSSTDREQTRVLRSYYIALRDALVQIVSASGAPELRTLLVAFLRRFLDTDRWDHADLTAFQRAMDELKQLAAAETMLNSPIERAYPLWLSLLEQTPYVSRHHESAVSVYPYRVAAGIRPAHHFVVNASHDGTRVLENPFSFLREDLRQSLQLPEQDFSDAFLHAYQVSGSNVRFSCSLESFAGPRFAAGRFDVQDISASATPEPGAPADSVADPYHAERDLWADGLQRLPPRIYPAQAHGIDHLAHTGFMARGTDFAREMVPRGPLRARLLQRSQRHAAESDPSPAEDSPDSSAQHSPDSPTMLPLSLSATRIDSYRACPFGHLLGHVLGIEEPSFLIDPQPARDVGSYQHAVLETLYRRLADQDPLLHEGRLEEAFRLLEDALHDQRLTRDALRTIPAPVLEVVRRLTREGVQHILQAEVKKLPQQHIAETERTVNCLLDDGQVAVSGRVDRLSSIPVDGSWMVVDYKRRGSVTRAAAVGREGDTARIETVQLLLYTLLVEQEGRRVGRTYYYLIERGEIRPIIDPEDSRARMNDERREELMQFVRRCVSSVADGLRRGDYRFPDPVRGCSDCRFRGICRSRFAVD